MAQNADIIMLWLTSFFKLRFPLVNLAQFFGGLLSVGAAYEMSRSLGFSRLWRLGVVITLLGIPNVGIQFFTSQTDLFTAGCLAAGLFFLLKALQDDQLLNWLLFGAGLGLAIGAKGTVFYWGPGLLFLLVGWVRMQRTPWKRVGKGAIWVVSLVLLLGGFNYAQNFKDYGNPFAPARDVRDSFAITTSRPYYAFVNGTLYLWQIFEPHSNFPLFRTLTDAIVTRLQIYLFALATEKSHFIGFPERFQLATQWIQSYGLNEDFASFGFPMLLLALLGGLMGIILLVKSRSTEAVGITAIFGSNILFLASFCFFTSWTVHQYRYFVLLGPFLAILSTFGLMKLPRSISRWALGDFLAIQIFMAGYVGFYSTTHGVLAMANPQAGYKNFLWNECNSLMQQLSKDKSLRVAIALKQDSWLAPYLRFSDRHFFYFAPLKTLLEHQTVEAFLSANRYDFLITDPKIVEGHLGRVKSYVSANGSRVGLRLLRNDEIANPLVTNAIGLYQDGWTMLTTSFRVENWSGGSMVLNLSNPTPFQRQVVLKSSIEAKHLTVAPQASGSFALNVSQTDTVTLDISPAFVPAAVDPGSPDHRALGVRLELPK